MQLFIPTIGTVLTLDKNWEFDLHEEYRNEAFWKLIFPNVPFASTWQNPQRVKKFCLKKGSSVRVDRIYIRKNKEEYDSITFVLTHDASGEIKKRPRFWVKLTDANQMFCHAEKEDE